VRVDLFPEGSKLTPRDLFQVLFKLYLSTLPVFRRLLFQSVNIPPWTRILHPKYNKNNIRLRRITMPKFIMSIEKRVFPYYLVAIIDL